jgi:hypothetical protein
MGTTKSIFTHIVDIRLAVFLTVILLMGGAPPSRALAQADDANPEPRAGAATEPFSFIEDAVSQDQKKNLNAIGSVLREGTFKDAQAEKDFDTFYKTFALARWTQRSSLTELPKYRQELLNNLFQAKRGQVHDHLNDLVIEYMKKLAGSDKYHPTVRYNAMLTIGYLNAVEGVQPTPLESVVPFLLSVIGDVKQIDPVKIAALIGINRYVTLGGKDPQNKIVTAMLDIVAKEAESSNPGQVWMRKQAVEILGVLGNLGNGNQVVKTLSEIVGNSKESFGIRCTAAESLGKLKYAAATGLNAVDLSKNLGLLLLDACNTELNGGNETSDDIYNHIRRIKARYQAVTDGLNGIKTLATAQPHQAYLTAFQTILTSFAKDIDKLDTKNKEKLTAEDFKKTLTDCQAKMDSWLAKKP